MQLSIIIPAYNVAAYLAACIDSLVSDILETNTSQFEIIIVNDGSTDGTHSIAMQYAMQYGFIRVIDKLNSGLSDARNTGIDAAKGEYISFIDSDDIIKPHFIFDILKVIQDNCDVDIITFDIHKFFGSPDFSAASFTYNVVDKYFYCSKPLIACNKVYKSELFNNIRFPIGRYYEDVWTTPSLIFNSGKFIHINNDYYGYRQRHGSITANVDSRYMDILGALNIISIKSDDGFIKNVMISQFFTLMLLSLRLPINNASKNIDIVFDFFIQQNGLESFLNKKHEQLAFVVFSLLKKKSKFLFLMCRPVVMLHLFIKNYRGR